MPPSYPHQYYSLTCHWVVLSFDYAADAAKLLIG